MTDASTIAAELIDADEDEFDPEREGLVLRPNGTIRLWIANQAFRLRRPRAREFRRLRESYQDAMDAIADEGDRVDALDDAAKAALQRRKAEDPAALATPEERRDMRMRGRQFTQFTEDTMTTWWAEVIEVLEVDGKTPDPEDMPAWVGVVPAANKLINHWRSVPSPSGVR